MQNFAGDEDNERAHVCLETRGILKIPVPHFEFRYVPKISPKCFLKRTDWMLTHSISIIIDN